MSLRKEVIFMAMELSKNNWKLAFGDGSRERQRTIPAGETLMLFGEIKKAKEKFGLSPDAAVVSCYEAGRDGFWIHRMLEEQQVDNTVMDPSSIEVSRRSRNRKTDRLDASRLLKLLIRAKLWEEEQVFSAVCVPTEEQEAQMRIGRERKRLVGERSAHRARMRSLTTLHGTVLGNPA